MFEVDLNGQVDGVMEEGVWFRIHDGVGQGGRANFNCLSQSKDYTL